MPEFHKLRVCEFLLEGMCNMLRPIDQQFNPKIAAELENLARRFRYHHKYPCSACRYYAADLSSSLEAGAMLSALLTGCSLLELYARRLVCRRFSEILAVSGGELQKKLRIVFARKEDNILEKFENDRTFGFKDFIEAMLCVNLASTRSANTAINIHNHVRTTLSHGLPLRFVKPDADFVQLFGPEFVTRDFENKIEDMALKYLQEISAILQSIEYCLAERQA